jgi:hypothetical protein
MDEESIFAAAIAIQPPAARAAFLAEACGGDEQLRSRVEALINSQENAGSGTVERYQAQRFMRRRRRTQEDNRQRCDQPAGL